MYRNCIASALWCCIDESYFQLTPTNLPTSASGDMQKKNCFCTSTKHSRTRRANLAMTFFSDCRERKLGDFYSHSADRKIF